MTFGICSRGLSYDIIDLMKFFPLHRRMFRVIGILSWLVAGAPTLLDLLWHPRQTRVVVSTTNRVKYLVTQTSGTRLALWIISFLLFGLAFWITSSATSELHEQRGKVKNGYVSAIAAQTAAALLMVYLLPGYSITILLVIVAWQLAILLPVWTALGWLLGQTALLASILYLSDLSNLTLFAVNTSLGLQLFAFATATIAKREARARQELLRANAELRATQTLLEDSSRLSERSRISSELHDILGHNLTALNIHLEVAKHTAQGKALNHIEKSQVLAKSILNDVRDVVSAVQSEDHIDLRRSLDELVRGLPYPRVILNVSNKLRITDAVCAQTVLRCIQEVVTNTLKHSGAQNLWIEVVTTDNDLEVCVRDDGCGAKSLELGTGLTGIRKRLEKVGGRVRFDSQDGQGFVMTAWVPLRGAVS